MEAVLSAIGILPLDEPADRHYAEIRHALESAGTPIGANDLLIAALLEAIQNAGARPRQPNPLRHQ